MKVSIVIPVFNEEGVIRECINSLLNQSIKDIEIIVVDDGSEDNSLKYVSDLPVKLLQQTHQGPGKARNLGASKSTGQILVFVDADMTFERDFIKRLVKPIEENKAVGTFSNEEYVSNKENIWSRCWNLNKDLPTDRMHPQNYPHEQKVFRAILKKEFERVGGFTPIGYIDDYTLSEKLGEKAVVAPGAIIYHKNPSNLKEVFEQARWIGKSEFKRRKIKNEQVMRIVSLLRHSLAFSLIKGSYLSLRYKIWEFVFFKIIYDFAVEVSLLGSFFGEQQYK